MKEIFNYDGVILYLLSDENEYKRYNKINAVDNYGYKYLTSKAYIQKNLKQGSFPSRFFLWKSIHRRKYKNMVKKRFQ